MITEDMMAPVGRLYKPHGFKGEINLDTDYSPELFENPKTPFFIKIDNILVPFFVERIGGGASGTAFLKFKGVDSDAEALAFVRKDLFTTKEVLSEFLGVEAGELEEELAGYSGYEVIDAESGQAIGTVEDIEEGVEYDYLIVGRAEGEPLSIPLVEEFVKEIRYPDGDGKGRVAVSLPEGFLEI